MTRSSELPLRGCCFARSERLPGGIPDARFCHRIGRNAFGGYNEATEQISAPGLKAFEERRHFAHVVAARGVLLLSGVIGAGVDGVVASDPAEQFYRAFVNLARYLEAAGASLNDVIEITSHHVGPRRHLDAFVVGPLYRCAIPSLVGDRRFGAHLRGRFGGDARDRRRPENKAPRDGTARVNPAAHHFRS